MNQSSIQAKLPDKLKSLINEVEARAGCPICWEQNESLEGEMWANVIWRNPTISYRNFTESGAAHELLHLKLMLSGFPRLLCPENLNLTRQVVIMLERVVQHLVIFPQLRALGYEADESGGIRRQLNQIRPDDFYRIANEPDLRAMFVMFYVRVQFETKDMGLQGEIKRVFTDKRLQDCCALGERVIKILRSTRNLKDKQKARSAYEQAIAILGQETITIEYQ